MPEASLDSLRPIRRSRLYEDLVERLAEFVRSAGLRPGDRLPGERELAQRLGVSRTSVRQAIVVLQAQGFVDVRHGGGVFVRRMHGFGESLSKLLERRRRLPEVLEARDAIEVKLAELAAERSSDEDVAGMRDAIQTMRDDIAAGGLGIQGDGAFHRALAHAAGNALLESLIEGLAEAIEETRLESLSEPGRPPRSIEAHELIVNAIASKEPESAARAMRAHLKDVADVAILRWRPDNAAQEFDNPSLTRRPDATDSPHQPRPKS